MEVVIREATITDLQDIQKLNLKLFEKEHKEYDPLLDLNWTFGQIGTKYFQDRIKKDDGFVVVAIVKNRTVGYLCGGITKAEDYRILPVVAELENTYVLSDVRSQGIGKQLYGRFIEWCKRKKVGKIRVEATAQNELAIKFYDNNGFKDYTLVLEADL